MRKDNYNFQLSVDTDSVFISQAPEEKKSRVLVANLDKKQLQNIAKCIIDADLKEKFLEMLEQN